MHSRKQNQFSRFRTVEDACPYGYEGTISFLLSHIKLTDKSKFEE